MWRELEDRREWDLGLVIKMLNNNNNNKMLYRFRLCIKTLFTYWCFLNIIFKSRMKDGH